MLKTKINTILLCTLFTLFFPLSAGAQYRNPILYADVPDMSVCRAGDYFYMVSTTMHLMPGAPIMRSPDMKHWETISYVFPRIDDGPRYDLLEGTAYGQGQWASSIRYHDGKFYVWFTANGAPGRGFVYTATDPAGPWKLLSRPPHFHDGSLLFDDDGRVYLFHSTGQLTELKPDLTDVLPGGINQQIFERDADEQGLLEGSSVIKYNGKYYLLMISMDWSIPGRLRREVCYRADKITGPYEKRVILETEFDGHGGVGQGCIVDGKNGEWYGLIFQDRGGVGRVPCLMPCTWTEDGWPMLGDKDGHIPNDTTLSYMSMDGICGSDDFSASGLSLYWQWNHNPVDQASFRRNHWDGSIGKVVRHPAHLITRRIDLGLHRTPYHRTALPIQDIRGDVVLALLVYLAAERFRIPVREVQRPVHPNRNLTRYVRDQRHIDPVTHRFSVHPQVPVHVHRHRGNRECRRTG